MDVGRAWPISKSRQRTYHDENDMKRHCPINIASGGSYVEGTMTDLWPTITIFQIGLGEPWPGFPAPRQRILPVIVLVSRYRLEARRSQQVNGVLENFQVSWRGVNV